MTAHRVIGFDQIIETDRPIRGMLAAHRGDRGHHALRIDWRPPVAEPTAPSAATMTDTSPWSIEGRVLRFVAQGVARYGCTRRGIEVTPFAGAAPAMVEALLVATALPAALWLRGAFMVHAAAIVPRNKVGALAIAGASGRGKSRLAAAFVAKGARFVADDSIAIRWGNREPRCAGLAGGYHLGIAGETERPFHRVSAGQTRRSAPLAAVIVLTDDPGAPRTRLPPVPAIEALLANRHRANVPRLCGLETDALRDAARLAETIPVHRWPCTDAGALLDDDIRGAILGI